MKGLIAWLDWLVERFCWNVLGRWWQCKASYPLLPDMTVYCVRHRHHLGPHRDNSDQWNDGNP